MDQEDAFTVWCIPVKLGTTTPGIAGYLWSVQSVSHDSEGYDPEDRDPEDT